MKFRQLRLEELEAVKDQFVQFLAVNGIDAQHWEQIKSENSNVESILRSFSDAWFETYLQRVSYLDVLLKDEIMSFQCLPNQMVMVGLSFKNSVEINATLDLSEIKRAVQNESCEVFTSSKKYASQRELELFKLMESGAVVSDGSWFKAISLAL